jgi:hypothetical protein
LSAPLTNMKILPKNVYPPFPLYKMAESPKPKPKPKPKNGTAYTLESGAAIRCAADFNKLDKDASADVWITLEDENRRKASRYRGPENLTDLEEELKRIAIEKKLV